MAAPLRIIREGSEKYPITVPDLLGLLSNERLDHREQQVRYVRETHQCPPTVRNQAEFRQQLAAFHLHYENAYLGNHKTTVTPESSFDFFRRHFKHDPQTAERNAIMGRDRGLIGVLDDITDSLVKLAVETYVDMILWDYIPHDHIVRMRLAEELLRTYGSLLFPGEDLVPAYVLAANIEAVLKGFAMAIHPIRREWRW